MKASREFLACAMRSFASSRSFNLFNMYTESMKWDWFIGTGGWMYATLCSSDSRLLTVFVVLMLSYWGSSLDAFFFSASVPFSPSFSDLPSSALPSSVCSSSIALGSDFSALSSLAPSVGLSAALSSAFFSSFVSALSPEGCSSSFSELAFLSLVLLVFFHELIFTFLVVFTTSSYFAKTESKATIPPSDKRNFISRECLLLGWASGLLAPILSKAAPTPWSTYSFKGVKDCSPLVGSVAASYSVTLKFCFRNTVTSFLDGYLLLMNKGRLAGSLLALSAERAKLMFRGWYSVSAKLRTWKAPDNLAP
mmetsp:Transcript_88645/g.147248  ORF Transcript_88645/g.147248 Transcript_88645/m.147248 type:complete len:308 (-) Transcript_88645:1265-2188(-)